mmetsp:Transcript_1326/g.4600  ORF Transcript_1326/g.4600 Transcript_1326/m.4600 type:complete len:129 (+) Transcript_1326:966-1352(+)
MSSSMGIIPAYSFRLKRCITRPVISSLFLYIKKPPMRRNSTRMHKKNPFVMSLVLCFLHPYWASSVCNCRPQLPTSVRAVFKIHRNHIREGSLSYHGQNFSALVGDAFTAEFTVVVTVQEQPNLSPQT